MQVTIRKARKNALITRKANQIGYLIPDHGSRTITINNIRPTFFQGTSSTKYSQEPLKFKQIMKVLDERRSM